MVLLVLFCGSFDCILWGFPIVGCFKVIGFSLVFFFLRVRFVFISWPKTKKRTRFKRPSISIETTPPIHKTGVLGVILEG